MSNFSCAAPWRSLHINPRGDVKTCCAGNPNMLGNLNTQTIDAILNGDTLKQIRSTLAQGQAPAYCENCVNAERLGGSSERGWHNSLNPDIDYATAGTEFHHTTLIDIRWNTTCNLSCNYCDPGASSVWGSLKGIPVRSGTRPYYEQVCDFIAQHHDKIQEVAMVGGEPLLLPENNRLLDVIPADALVTIITNVSTRLESNKIFQKLAARPRVGWSMSFDNIGPRFEYVRHGADWATLTQNLKTVKNLIDHHGHHGGIHAVYNIYNATRLCEFVEFAREQGVSIVWQNLFWPEHLNPFLHNSNIRDLAVAEIQRLYDTGLATESDRAFFDNIIESYANSDDTRAAIVTTAFKKHVEDIESLYHPDQKGQFAKLWPELAQA